MTTFSGTFYEDQLCALKKVAKNSLNMVPIHRVKLWSYVSTTIRGIITRITTVLLLAHLATPATAHIRQLVGTKQNVLLPETGTVISFVSKLAGQIQKHVCYILYSVVDTDPNLTFFIILPKIANNFFLLQLLNGLTGYQEETGLLLSWMFRGNWFKIYQDIQKELVLFSPGNQAEVETGLLYRYWCLDIKQELVYYSPGYPAGTGYIMYLDIQQELVSYLPGYTERTDVFYTWISTRDWFILCTWISSSNWFIVQQELVSYIPWYPPGTGLFLYLDIQQELVSYLPGYPAGIGVLYTWISRRKWCLIPGYPAGTGLFYTQKSSRNWCLIYLGTGTYPAGTAFLSTWISSRNWFILYLDIQQEMVSYLPE